MVASFVRIPSISVFENANSAVDFMPTELLHDSLYDTLSKFPVLVGRLRKGDNGFLSVAVDKYDLNMPEFKEIYCDTHYDELAEANFSTKCLPNWDSTSSAFATGRRVDEIKLASVQIVRLQDNSGRMSHNDLMVTLITVAMAQCAIPPLTNEFDELQQPVTLGLLGTVAKRVRHSVDAVTTEFVQQFADGVHSSRDCYLRPIVCGPKHPMKILTTNHTRLGYYENNFGFGAPAWVCPPEGLFPNFIVMLPAPPNKDGYNIFINAPTDILDRVKAHEYWSSMTEFVN
ncbi:hypothetical protein LPJ61_004183 [Coemansia biformis]|uniref:Uncharacterized protein n=1 Tax=Coemansia biformis TaxID=1286918 RepID=A0A9W8CUX8_9FUNG|nr:hypothetical protein LPJ61_004183 [Coemansia biformis]